MRSDTLKIQIRYLVNSAHRILLMIISLYYYTKSEVQHRFKDRNIFCTLMSNNFMICLVLFHLFVFIIVKNFKGKKSISKSRRLDRE